MNSFKKKFQSHFRLPFMKHDRHDKRLEDSAESESESAHRKKDKNCKTVYPKVKGTPKLLGLVTDPNLHRDSLGSSKFGSRVLWTARDSQPYGADGRPVFPISSSSASWSDINSDDTPKLQPVKSSHGPYRLLVYGDNHNQPYFPIPLDKGKPNSAGGLPDGTRYAIWPDSPPMVTEENESDESTSILAYTWVKKARIRSDLSVVVENPGTILYRIIYRSTRDDNNNNNKDKQGHLPRVEVVTENFWDQDRIPFGTYGNCVRNGIAYLWGQSADKTTALARVPIQSVEDKSKYEFWVRGQWTATEPALHDEGIHIPNANAGGQGTYYFSDIWQCYVWIGQEHPSVAADFYITTAPEPQGPWIEPYRFYSAQNGSFHLGAYTLQAHPALVKESENAMYLTYTKNDNDTDGGCTYSTPLVYVEWK